MRYHNKEEWTPSNQVPLHSRRRRKSLPHVHTNHEALNEADKMQKETKKAAHRITKQLDDIEKVGEMTLEDLYEQRRKLDVIEQGGDEVNENLDKAGWMHTKLESWIPLPMNMELPKIRRHHHHRHDDDKYNGGHEKKNQEDHDNQPRPADTSMSRAKVARHFRHSVNEIKAVARNVGELVVPHNHSGHFHRHSVTIARHDEGHGKTTKHQRKSDGSSNNDCQDTSSKKLTEDEEMRLRSLQRGDQEIDTLLDGIGTKIDTVGDIAEEMGAETQRQNRKLESLNETLDQAEHKQKKVNARTRKLVMECRGCL